ncbi:MAG: HvfC/BufC family peptide modification chaperone [Planctomycetota bacterium]|jgi:hypothetical protein
MSATDNNEAPLAQPPQSLREIQSWFLDAITRLGPREAGHQGPPPAAASDVCEPSASLTADERVAIYARSYYWRLFDCLTVDFPVLWQLLGDDGFHALARGYLTKYPSGSYTLNVLGVRMPRFLEEEPEVVRPYASPALLADVARLELAMAQVFDERLVDPLPVDALKEVTPSRWGDLRLSFIPAFQLHRFAHKASQIVTAIRQEEGEPDLQPTPTFVAVYRKDNRVWRWEQSEAQHVLLTRLLGGETLASAIEAAQDLFEGTVEEFAERLTLWFRGWNQERFFASFSLAGSD